MKIILIDTSAFINGYNFYQNKSIYTVPNVKKEIFNELAKLRYENAVLSCYLIEKNTTPKYLDQIVKIIEVAGETELLSNTDKQILALALMFKSNENEVEIITDDYSLQNLATLMGINFKSTITKGIKKVLKWIIYCPGCKKIYNKIPIDGICIICGTQLKRKPKK